MPGQPIATCSSPAATPGTPGHRIISGSLEPFLEHLDFCFKKPRSVLGTRNAVAAGPFIEAWGVERGCLRTRQNGQFGPAMRSEHGTAYGGAHPGPSSWSLSQSGRARQTRGWGVRQGAARRTAHRGTSFRGPQGLHRRSALEKLAGPAFANPASTLGKGKVAELGGSGKRTQEMSIPVLVLDCALSPVQQRNLRYSKPKVIDRTN